MAKADFRQRAEVLRSQLLDVQRDLETAAPYERTKFLALQASLKRSLRWYAARAGTRADFNALSVQVEDVIHTHDPT